ncbi:MAG: polysaccharide deacetylase, partial [Lachnospiraceae bacterium]|nr:polysaccharide deacetylase [Lachnospiraceae bacterium]
DGIMSALSDEVQARGYQYWDWNAETGDGGSVTTAESISNALSCEAETIVMLCHDGEAKETTVEALPTIIEEYLARGYVFKPLDRQATVVHHEIFN